MRVDESDFAGFVGAFLFFFPAKLVERLRVVFWTFLHSWWVFKIWIGKNSCSMFIFWMIVYFMKMYITKWIVLNICL